MISIAVAGVAGRMGAAVTKIVASTPTAVFAGGFEDVGHSSIGRPLSEIINYSKVVGLVMGNAESVLKNADVLIDFTTPYGSIANLKECAKLNKPIVIGTTGLDIEQKKILFKYSKQIPIVFASNMSVGMNLMFKLVGIITKILGTEYALELIEAHHDQKKDAPSGSSMQILEEIANVRGVDLNKTLRYTQPGIIRRRNKEEIGVNIIRAGDIIGDHSVFFIGYGERIELTHKVHTRDIFAQGAIRAALWLVNQKPGCYDMQSVLGLKKKNSDYYN